MVSATGYEQSIAARSDQVERDILLPESLVPALAGLANPDVLVQPMLDTLWQCFDARRCLEYDATGRWVGPAAA